MAGHEAELRGGGFPNRSLGTRRKVRLGKPDLHQSLSGLTPQVVKLDACAVAAEADVAGGSLQAGVFAVVDRLRLAGFVEVDIDDRRAVEIDRHLAAAANDFF